MEKKDEKNIEGGKPLFEKIAETSDSPFTDLVRISYGDSIASYVESPIEDQEYLTTLKTRSNEFEVNGSALPFKLIEEFTYDLGGVSLNDSFTISAIDMERSKELIEYISKKLSFHVTPNNTRAAFLTRRTFDPRMSRRVGAFAFGYREFILINTYDIKKRSRYGIYTLDNTGFDTLFYKHIRPKELEKIKKDKIVSRLNKMIPDRSKRFTGFYNKVLALKNGKWRPVKLKQLERFTDRKKTLILGFKEVALKKTSLRKIFHWNTYVVYAPEEEEEEEEETIDNVHGTLHSVMATVANTVDIKKLGVAGHLFHTTVGEGTGEEGPTGQIMYGPEASAGRAGCSAFESETLCKACCDAFRILGIAGVVAAAIKCHVSAGCCLGAHVACLVAEGLAAAAVWEATEECGENCERPYWHEYEEYD
ncbi:MAG: hypothetical protein ACFFB5_16780 [Promethearchaeota archaeon]